MAEQQDDYFDDVFRRYFHPAADPCPRWDDGPVGRMFSLTDAVQDPLEQSRRAAMAWGHSEVPDARIAMELFVITQHGLVYAAELSRLRRALYFLATPPALFDPFVHAIESGELRQGAVVVVDSRLGHDLAAAHPMDAVLRRILDQHQALRVDLPRTEASAPMAGMHG